jgi:hypothetical protein
VSFGVWSVEGSGAIASRVRGIFVGVQTIADAEFVTQLERATLRPLAPQKGGRPKNGNYILDTYVYLGYSL